MTSPSKSIPAHIPQPDLLIAQLLPAVMQSQYHAGALFLIGIHIFMSDVDGVMYSHKPHRVVCSQLTVFGDSLTDDGIEVDEHSHGFVRSSNGPVWPEYLNKMLNCDKYVNYAHNGAKSGYDNVYFSGWSGILWQINTFLADNQALPPDSVTVLQSGGVTDFLSGEDDEGPIIENISLAVSSLLGTLSSGTVIVMNLADPSGAPGIKLADNSVELAETLARLVSSTNSKLSKKVFEQHRVMPTVGLFDLNTAVFDSSRRLNLEEPFTHHLTNTTSRSIYRYAYHDQWNPSTFVHHAIAEKLIKYLEDL